MDRPSIDPEVLIRMLLIGYLYGITSERKLCEEVTKRPERLPRGWQISLIMPSNGLGLL